MTFAGLECDWHQIGPEVLMSKYLTIKRGTAREVSLGWRENPSWWRGRSLLDVAPRAW